ncbi:MAG: Bifunctional NAD(P)H-hydrate repair enzyme Nnr [Chlamydiae bacterium]|nr:Bifunctional NAD(P)H-hydrate repair enzyme Nnr [Chlamydiota bacterium]
MKVVTAKEMARIEQLAYQHGSNEEAFMNQAGVGISVLIQQCVAHYHLKPKIMLLCGRGNNGGDAYAAGKELLNGGFEVQAIALAPIKESSPLCQLQSKRFKEAGGKIRYIDKAGEISFDDAELLVDGILGTGFRGSVEGLYFSAIERANISGLPIVAIDIPSGINGNTGEVEKIAIHASETIFLGLPKTGCFLGEAWNFVGKVHVYDFGLGEEFIEQAEEDFILLDDNNVDPFLPEIVRTRHKYQAGYVVGVGGSPGMPGAPILTSYAALRAGAGIVRLLHPHGMRAELAGAPYELIREGFKDENDILAALPRASAVFVGPGIGTSSEAEKLLTQLLPKIDKPCVIDAEALTILAKHPIDLPPQTVMTPHHGEMFRLLGVTEELPITELITRCHEYAEKKKITLVLKGAPTIIFHPGKVPHICSRGDPGMATAGSGDVLTGIIAAFLAQQCTPFEAAAIGVYFHGLAGEIAAQDLSSYSMVASDITDALSEVFLEYQIT